MKHALIEIDENAKRQYELKQTRPILFASLVGKTPAQIAAAVKADLDDRQRKKPGGVGGTESQALANRVAALEEQMVAALQMIIEQVERDG